MENKKNYKNNSTSNLDQIKPKLIKRDIKIVPNKKENIIPSVFNINKSITKKSSQNINDSNQKNKTKKFITKSREIKSSKGTRNIDKPKKRARKFKNIDEIVLLLQKHVRKYLERIHNDPKLQMIRMLKEKKKNLFENYKIEKNPALISEFKKEQVEKNKNDENMNLNEQDNIEKELNENIENNNNEVNIEDKNEIENQKIIIYVVKKSDKLNEDLEGLQDEFDDLSSIDEDILKNYIEEPKEINLDNNINKIKKKRKKPANNFKFEIVIDKKNKLDNNNDINSNQIILENKQDINDKNNIEIQDDNKLNNIITNNPEEKTNENILDDKLNNKEILENDNSKDNVKLIKNDDNEKKNELDLEINKIPIFEEKEKIITDENEKNS
jgi:hypothetical protein